MVRRQIASEISVANVWGCAHVSGLFVELSLLAIMESARRWSTKWIELRKGSHSHTGLSNAG